MLAGRKLLLADDSITIQKVVDLTFADEGVSVVSVNNGREAIEKLDEFIPDVVLADVFMPQVNGYEVCDYIKQNAKLKHIPVMLLVGSFEPFDEAEARRVGADDTLTKPFQSIRRLIDKVGVLVSGRREGDEGPTAELPKKDSEAEPETLSDQELAITTADTQPLPEELGEMIKEPRAEEKVDQQTMESKFTQTQNEYSQSGGDDLLLDLGSYPTGAAAVDEDFVLDIDLEETPEPSPAEPAYSAPAFLNRGRYTSTTSVFSGSSTAIAEPMVATEDQMVVTEDQMVATDDQMVATDDQMAPTQEFARPIEVEPEPIPPPVYSAPTSVSGELSPEMIDAIARRAVELMSEKAVQEIAWEVVPQLAELMIKRQLEEKNS